MKTKIDKNEFWGKLKKKTSRQGTFPIINNPWRGLSSYEEPIEGLVRWKFCGRDNESFELTRLIDDNIFVTLYGKSGNGKTSLLKAGVFPKLRKLQYEPIYIRLGMYSAGISFQRSIINSIENCFKSERMETRNVIKRNNDEKSVDYLWNYFVRHRFYSNKHHDAIVYPVIVLDQFEELYRHRQVETDLLLRQINYLAEESHVLEDCMIGNELYTYEYNFRFVASIREDDLYHLEDSVDNNMLYLMKQSRYRLRPLSTKDAKDVIFIPGEGLFEEKEKDKIADTIIGIAKGKNSEISSNILSLICSRIYVDHVQKGQVGKISFELVSGFISEKPLDKFYNEATAHLTRKQRAYLEDNLVDTTERRDSVPKSEFEQVLKKDGNELLNGPFKILHENNGKIELIHDSFCQVLIDQKLRRLERWRTVAEHVFLGIMCFLLCHTVRLIVQFNYSYETSSVISEVYSFLMGSTPFWSPIFLFIVVGIIRKSFPPFYSFLAGMLILVPIVADISSSATSVHLPAEYYILALFLFSFVVISYLYNIKKRPDNKDDRNSFGSLVDYQSLRIWCLVYYFYLFNYYVYNVFNGSHLDHMVFGGFLVFIPTLFYSIFDKDGWGIVGVLLMVISFLLFATSDTQFLHFTVSSMPGILLFPVISFGIIFYALWDFYDDSKLIKRLTPIIIFLAVTFVIYALFYKYKIIMLAVWCMLIFGIMYFIFRDENKWQGLICVVAFFFTIFFYTYTKCYNPFIKNVDITMQKGQWHWNTVMANAGDGYRIFDGVTGRDLLGIEFDCQDNDLNLVKKLDCSKIHLGYEISNELFSISDTNSTLTYRCHPLFERSLSVQAQKGVPLAVVAQKHRDRILNDFVNPTPNNTVENIKPLILDLLRQEWDELNAIMSSNEDSILKNHLSEQLCKVLSTSWLYYSVDSAAMCLPLTGHRSISYINYISAFGDFILSHYYRQFYDCNNNDWDGSFEKMSLKYIEWTDSLGVADKNMILELVVPNLIVKYVDLSDYGLKTLLYGKIIRLQQLAILQGYGNKKWASIRIDAPVAVDIPQFLSEHKLVR